MARSSEIKQEQADSPSPHRTTKTKAIANVTSPAPLAEKRKSAPNTPISKKGTKQEDDQEQDKVLDDDNDDIENIPTASLQYTSGIHYLFNGGIEDFAYMLKGTERISGQDVLSQLELHPKMPRKRDIIHKASIVYFLISNALFASVSHVLVALKCLIFDEDAHMDCSALTETQKQKVGEFLMTGDKSFITNCRNDPQIKPFLGLAFTSTLVDVLKVRLVKIEIQKREGKKQIATIKVIAANEFHDEIREYGRQVAPDTGESALWRNVAPIIAGCAMIVKSQIPEFKSIVWNNLGKRFKNCRKDVQDLDKKLWTSNIDLSSTVEREQAIRRLKAGKEECGVLTIKAFLIVQKHLKQEAVLTRSDENIKRDIEDMDYMMMSLGPMSPRPYNEWKYIRMCL
jgi:hypothetical protein